MSRAATISLQFPYLLTPLTLVNYLTCLGWRFDWDGQFTYWDALADKEVTVPFAEAHARLEQLTATRSHALLSAWQVGPDPLGELNTYELNFDIDTNDASRVDAYTYAAKKRWTENGTAVDFDWYIERLCPSGNIGLPRPTVISTTLEP
ncbi:hypothetical protein SAMN02745857_02151 [Andreprevotia lacus DSM 23236]|jgi:hypothetical protein|uniref:Uncharacterized protein n=1 Tax=Andreprevotia lacus DSM 23236 TaxID=1121001 RepID=A0A1W1XPD5_9NEIS|nr:hypothetical protein [Andreprevotia lacus]SMC25381.1 hypothetical protein SAMN02745857_02151 [Andreprevotia lacus DSM 23236]